MRVKRADFQAEADLLDRFEVALDQDAEPADLDEVLADFLLTLIDRRHSVENSGGGEVDQDHRRG